MSTPIACELHANAIPARAPKVGDAVVLYRDRFGNETRVGVFYTHGMEIGVEFDDDSDRVRANVPYDPSGTIPHSWRWP
jgi:hypothetical protein